MDVTDALFDTISVSQYESPLNFSRTNFKHSKFFCYQTLQWLYPITVFILIRTHNSPVDQSIYLTQSLADSARNMPEVPTQADVVEDPAALNVIPV